MSRQGNLYWHFLMYLVMALVLWLVTWSVVEAQPVSRKKLPNWVTEKAETLNRSLTAIAQQHANVAAKLRIGKSRLAAFQEIAAIGDASDDLKMLVRLMEDRVAALEREESILRDEWERARDKKQHLARAVMLYRYGLTKDVIRSATGLREAISRLVLDATKREKLLDFKPVEVRQ